MDPRNCSGKLWGPGGALGGSGELLEALGGGSGSLWGVTTGAPRFPKEGHSRPRGAQDGPKGSHGHPKTPQREPKPPQRTSKGSPRAPQRNPKGAPGPVPVLR